jgi:arylsulfatase A-like enzyme
VLLALLGACVAKNGPDSAARDSRSDDSDTVDTGSFEAPSLVLLITIDALHRDFLGLRHPKWNVTPVLDELIGESTFFGNVMTVRGLTSVALGSLLTGAYPKHTGLRSHTELIPSDLPHLAERFEAAGWTTLGFSANQCQYLSRGFASHGCSYYDGVSGDPDHARGDAWLTGEFLRAIEEAPPGPPVFAWIHFMDPHDPYVATEHIAEFYPGGYTGDLDVWSTETLSELVLDGIMPSTEDLAYIDAVYASQVRGVDDNIGFIVNTLKAWGLYDGAVIAFGADHGEELYAHNAYPFHGCSLYQDVLATSWAVKESDDHEGKSVDAWASITDIAPTLIELAGLSWTGLVDGVSLVPFLRGEPAGSRAVFFERDPEAAGIVLDDTKLFLTTEHQYRSCEPFVDSGRGSYDTPEQGLFDLAADPGENDNLIGGAPDTFASMAEALCAWITEDGWLTDGDDAHSSLVKVCEERILAH